MAGRPKITITMVDKKGDGACHYGHKIGDRFDFDQDRGKMCPMMLHTAFRISTFYDMAGRFRARTVKMSACSAVRTRE